MSTKSILGLAAAIGVAAAWLAFAEQPTVRNLRRALAVTLAAA